MSEQPTPILIVTGRNGDGEVLHAMTALQAGALALINKPSSVDRDSFTESARQLIRHIRAMAGMKLVKIRRKEQTLTPSQPLPPDTATTTDQISESRLASLSHVAIAASTGGPAALAKVLKGLPEDFPLPILIVQHIAPGFIQGFAEWLASQVLLKVEIARPEQSAKPGVIYLAPEDKHLGLNANGNIELSCSAKISGFRPSANYLFQSLATHFPESTLSIVLTGMGNDGLLGALALKQGNALIISQDEASSVVYGMPKAVADAGLHDTSLALSEIHNVLLKLHRIHSEKAE